jgi:hypothetical protein
MLPTIRAFMAAHQLADVTIVADAGMVSDGNRRAIEAAGLSFILGAKIPDIPYAVTEWRREHPGQNSDGEPPPDGLILTQPRPAGPSDRRRDEVVYYQYKADRARRTLRGIDEQVSKAERAVAGKVPVKRNRFIKLVGADKSVNRALEAKARALAGWWVAMNASMVASTVRWRAGGQVGLARTGRLRTVQMRAELTAQEANAIGARAN